MYEAFDTYPTFIYNYLIMISVSINSIFISNKKEVRAVIENSVFCSCFPCLHRILAAESLRHGLILPLGHMLRQCPRFRSRVGVLMFVCRFSSVCTTSS
jgi:hypothetical protein